ncbi:hypothetical protein [Thermoleptolyngbya sp. M55_K2018_002]|uniref:hypothetical protein n=1 Tax=Thermoleptolyngbya sp. M55_K2018_002 TaxID=2747808 RepID=UPI0019E61F2B|nr:hypothetical protein [Thermoleptolyngbya sp. M55_K2018_002]HIK41276.1 hypothetical protein [Thermoleptolyngbya sp. M55_K2018_002]
MAAHQDARERLEQVSQLIEGFKTPYGMEMLATLHWVAKEDPAVAEDVEVAIALVHKWSDRKRQLFKPQHLQKAWQCKRHGSAYQSRVGSIYPLCKAN